MAIETPGLAGQEKLTPLDSRYVTVDDLSWKPTQVPGIDMKILMQDKEAGLLTALFRWEPIEDDEGTVSEGNYVWRPKGNQHYAYSPNGALVLSFFLRPNVFLEQFAGEKLE